MKELTVKEFNIIIEEIQKFHKFGYIEEDIIENKKKEFPNYNPKMIKYVDLCYDTREDHSGIWSITFRNGSLNYTVDDRTKSQYNSMYEHIIAWLQGKINE